MHSVNAGADSCECAQPSHRDRMISAGGASPPAEWYRQMRSSIASVIPTPVDPRTSPRRVTAASAGIPATTASTTASTAGWYQSLGRSHTFSTLAVRHCSRRAGDREASGTRSSLVTVNGTPVRRHHDAICPSQCSPGYRYEPIHEVKRADPACCLRDRSHRMAMSLHGVWSPTSSDAELIAAVRGGDSVAFGQLYERHSAAARAVARQYSNSPADAEDVVSDAFAKVFTILQGGGGPDVAFRAYLFTVVRRVAIASLGAGRRVQPTDDLAQYEGSIGSEAGVDEPAMAGFERGVVAKAYDSLPERWQAVLWYTEVEGLQPAQIGPILGLTANGVAELAYRAREGLRQAYLQNHLTTVKDESCRAVSDKLGAYVRGGLAKREQALVDQHLDECPKCRGLVLELADVNHGMRVVIAPLVLGLAGLAALQQGLPFASAAAGAGAAGAAGGGSAGAGAGVGSGVGVSSGVGSGGGMFGAGASGWLAAASQTAFPSVFAGASSYASVAAATASAGGAHDTLVGAGVGSTGAAGGGAGGSAGFGAIGAFFGSLPTGVLGVLVGGVVIAVGVVSAGALGVFSPGPGRQQGIVAELSPTPSGTTARSEERRVGKECRSR